MKITWTTKHFTQLSSNQLYQILRLRSQVFVVEQKCLFLDLDNHDQNAYHILGQNADGNLIATSRIFSPGIVYPNHQSIGRVVCAPKYRNNGIGKRLMAHSILECNRIFGNIQPIKIGAQYQLLRFYESFGFQSIGEKYEEDGIDHIEMIRP